MHSYLALRLLWKEYRMQRGLWLAMAFGCVLIQVIVSQVVPGSPEAFHVAMSLAAMLTFFYTIGSGAMTFAIEREEGTQIRPVMLGCPPALTLCVKLLFGILATVLLIATTVCSGMLLTQGSLIVPPDLIPANASIGILPLVVLVAAIPYLGALLWSMFFSLVTRTVIMALGLATIAMITTYVLVVSVLSAFTVQRGQTPTVAEFVVSSLIPGGCVLLLLFVNYLLTHRWLNHVFFDQRTVRSPSVFRRFRLSRSALDGGVTLEIGGEDRTAFEVLQPDVAVCQPPPRLGLSMLYSMWGPNRWRHLRFLRWKEAFETRKLYLGFLLAAVLVTIWSTSGRRYSVDYSITIFIFMSFSSLCCGVMAYRKEQADRLFLKLADMGVKPRTVWFSKHLVWLLRSFLSGAAILFGVIFARFVAGVLFGSYGLPFIDINLLQWRLASRSTEASWLMGEIIGRALIMVLTLYSIGQLCSQLIRSSIVSVFVAFLLAFVTFGWASVCAHFGVPWTLSVLPLAFGCLLVTWFRSRHWMLDDRRPRTWVLPLICIVGAFGFAYTGTQLFRVYEVPWVAPVYTGSDVEARSSQPLSTKEKDTFAMYRRAAELLPADSDETRESVLRLIEEAAASSECAEFNPAETDLVMVADSTTRKKFSSVFDEVLSAAEREVDAGHLEVALNRYNTAFAISRHAAGRGAAVAFDHSHELTRKTLTAIQKWAKHSDVSPTLLKRAFQIVDEHRSLMIPLEMVNCATAMTVRNTLNADVLTMSQLAGNHEARMGMIMSMEFPGERARCHRLLNQLESYDASTTDSYRIQLAAAGNGMAQWFRQYAAGERSSNSSFSRLSRLTPVISFFAYEGSVRRCQLDFDTEYEVRATKVLLRLLLVRRESEVFPDTLDEFDAALNDPWDNKPFTWYPRGVNRDLVKDSIIILQAGTPFLITARGVSGPMYVMPWPDAESDFSAGGEGRAAMFAPDDSDASPENERASVDRQSIRTVFGVNGSGQAPGTPGFLIWKLPAELAAE